MSSPSRILTALRAFAATGVSLVATRLSLLRVEAEEEALRLLALLLWSIVAVLAGFFALVFFAVLVTVLFWDGQRLLALGIFTALFSALALVAGVLAVRRVQEGSRLFAATLAELARDAEALQTQENPPKQAP